MQLRYGLLILVLALLAAPLARGEEESPDDLAKRLYAQYLLERRDGSSGAFRRRLSALRSLSPIACERARASLLKVARTGKALDDRILAVQGIARHGDLASVQELLAVLAKKGHPVLTQVAGEALAQSKDGEVVTWLAEESLALPGPALGPVLRAHSLLVTPEAAERLTAGYERWAASPTTVDLAHDALQALGRGRTTEAMPALLQASKDPDPRLRLAVADVLARQDAEDQATVTAVRALLDDEQAVVRRAAARGIERAESEAFVPDVMPLLEDEDPRTRKTALDVLRRMTKKDFGFDAGAWRRWWEKRDTPDAPEPHTVPTYHGLPIFTERVVFVLDRSPSMHWPHAKGVTSRMAVAKDALVKVLEEVAPATRFNLLSFDSKVSAWNKAESEADPKSIAKATKWVRKQDSKRGALTNTYGVLKQAFEDHPTIDTIYFLSDGIPEDGEIKTDEGILAAVREWNRYRRVEIHVIALTLMYIHPGKYPITGSMRRAEAFMRELATIGGGRFKHVDDAPVQK